MFDITPEDIALLNDTDLRDLIGRLCEEELRKAGLSTACVSYGGNQTAEDGGNDVRVELPPSACINGYFRRRLTVFQSKAQDMPRAAILKEMRPKGVVRPVLNELASQSGSYIIASSKGSTAETSLQDRRSAMRDAVKGVKGVRNLDLHFYDRTKLATWVREHPGLVVWVRERIGRSFNGWRPYGAWASLAEDVSAEYLPDDKVRVQADRRDMAEGLSAEEGINQIRELLREQRNCVRLVGLSGVGKTRFVQALFDERIGKNGLAPALAIIVIYLMGRIQPRLAFSQTLLLKADEP